MLAILACGLPTLRSPAPRRTLLTAPSTTGDTDPVAALGTTVGAVLHEGGTVVAVVPGWADEPTRRHLQTVRSAFDTTRLVVHTTDLPPLAAAAFAGMLAEVAEDAAMTPSALLHGLPELESRVVGAAWLGSVAKLRHPAPSLRMHARSWLPRGAFAAIVDDDPRVQVLPKDPEVGILLPPADRAGSQVLLAVGTGDVARVERSLVADLPDATIGRHSISPVSTRWWGTERLIEVAVRPRDTDAVVAELVTSAPTTRCAWCDRPAAGPVCPFCHMRQADAAVAVPSPGGHE